jgi:hypothetical protein
MTNQLQEISQAQAQDLALRSLGFVSTKAPDWPSIYAEALRLALWSGWHQGQQPVYVTRMLNAAERSLIPWQSQNSQGDTELRETLRLVLEELELVGDVASLPGGHWVPAPLRLVEIASIERTLILGGLPTKYMPGRLRSALSRAGISRLTTPETIRSTADLAHIDTVAEREWLRMPEGDLSAWTQQTLGEAALERAGDLMVEVYAPAHTPQRASQYYRWLQLSRAMPDGRYLARTRMRRGSLAHYIVLLERGAVAAAAVLPSKGGTIRRLMYGLDLQATNPVQVKVQRSGAQSCVIVESDLPLAEQRLLLAFGREEVRQDGKYYPRRWTVPPQYLPRVEKALRELGIRIAHSGG